MRVGGHSVWPGTHLSEEHSETGGQVLLRVIRRAPRAALELSNHSKHHVVPSLNTACVTNDTFDSCLEGKNASL